MDPTALLRALGTTYATAAAYRDVGRMVFPHRGRTSDEATVGTFRTAFIRSKGFRFEYRVVPPLRSRRDRSAWRTFAIHVEHGKIVNVRRFDPLPETLNLAVAGLTGITFGAAHTVLRLLLPDEIGGRTLSEATSPKLVRTYHLDGQTRFALRLKDGSGDEIVVDERFVLWRVGSVRPNTARSATEAVSESSFRHVCDYEPTLFAEEDPSVTLDW